MLKDGVFINNSKDFKLGIRENLKFNDKGELMLQEQKLQGNYISPEIEAGGFKELVASWNAQTQERSELEVAIQIKVEEKWSIWFTYGKWSVYGIRGSVKGQIDELARMNIDLLTILNGKKAKAFRYKVTLSRSDLSINSPTVRAIYFALSFDISKEQVLDEKIKGLIDLKVPERSQMTVPKIGNIICSPTSLAMVMEYYGDNIQTEKVAANVLDYSENIYGNWSYNVAYAGARGLTAYVARFTSINEIKRKISEGIPVIASIRTKTIDELKGTHMPYPSGHLIVVRGFTIGENGEEYVIVNDPADPEGIAVRREYLLSEFERAWKKFVYIITPNNIESLK